MTQQRQEHDETVNTGGAAYVRGNVTVSGGDFVGRDKVGGDQTIATIGAGASNVVVGKNNRQTITSGYAPSTANDKQIIEAQLQRVLDALNAATIDLRKAGRAEGDLATLKTELTKTEEGQTPNADTITRIGDWLLDNVPELAQALTELFGLPAVGRVLGKAGEAATQWWKKRVALR